MPRSVAVANFSAGEYAIGEAVEKPEDLVVSKARIESDLGDDIGRRIERVGREWCCSCCLRPTVPNRKLLAFPCVVSVAWGFSIATATATLSPKLLVKRMPYWRAKSKPTLYEGQSSWAGRRWFCPCRRQEKFPSPFSVTRLHAWPPRKLQPLSNLACAPRLAETESVAVGLGRGGGDAGREEVGRDVAGKIRRCSAAINEDGDLGLAGRAEKLRQLALRGARHGKRVKGRRHVRAPALVERRTNAASAYPPGVMLIPRKRIVIGLSICLLNTCGDSPLGVCEESCSDYTAFFNTAVPDVALLGVPILDTSTPNCSPT